MRAFIRPVRVVTPALTLIALAGCASETGSMGLIASEAPAWETLFNGHDLTGWKPVEADHSTWQVVGSVKIDEKNPRKFVATPGTGVLLNSPGGRTSNLVSTQSFGDCELHVEWTVPTGSNSGIYFESRYEIQIFDSFGKKELGVHDAGAIYSQWINEKDVNGHTPLVNVAKAPGEWQTFDVTFRAPRINSDGKKLSYARFERILMNGTLIHENVEMFGFTRAGLEGPEVATGPFLLQGDHGPVAFRNFRVKPLN